MSNAIAGPLYARTDLGGALSGGARGRISNYGVSVASVLSEC